MSTFKNRVAAMTIWRNHCEQMTALRKTALELLVHPDTTAEQLAKTHIVMVEVMKKHRELRPRVAAIWPAIGTMPDVE